jgi:purine-binding chemotaxis protein CheW
MAENKLNNSEANVLLQLISFELEEEQFGIDIYMVQEIIRMVPITKIPNSPDFVEGVINIRGRIIPVVNLRSRMGMPEKVHDNNSRIIVVEVNKQTTGFIVDAVNEVLRVPVNITEEPPEIVTGVNSEYIKSVGKLEDRILILIDFERVLSKSEQLELQTIN